MKDKKTKKHPIALHEAVIIEPEFSGEEILDLDYKEVKCEVEFPLTSSKCEVKVGKKEE